MAHELMGTRRRGPLSDSEHLLGVGKHQAAGFAEDQQQHSEHQSPFPEDDEEAECRVCRGEAEPERRLFAPCKCSGSIRYTHADCLEQWLEHSGKNFCELCSYQFEFKPLYDANAPDVLPWSELMSTIMKMAVTKWLPFCLRGLAVLVLWLGVAPWCTSWLYRMWLLRASAMVNVNFSERFEVHHVMDDILSGIILIVCIVFSFLSLMSFADFLRFHLDQIDEPVEEEERPQHPVRIGQPIVVEDVDGDVIRQDVQNNPVVAREGHPADDLDDMSDEENLMNQDHDAVAMPHDMLPGQNFEAEVDQWNMGAQAQEGLRRRQVFRAIEGAEVHDEVDIDRNQRNIPEMPRVENGNDAQQNANRDWDDDFDHMEINIEMDELLGLRGDVSVLFRNVSWFLAFNGAYLGLFAFIPYTLGSTITTASSRLFSALTMGGLSPEVEGVDQYLASFLVKSLYDSIETARKNGDCLQLVDLCTCCVGYFSICFTIVLWRFMVTMASSYIHRPLMGGLLWALRCLTAIVKVSTLLIVKMVVLPVSIGLGIDFATLQLFDVSARQRISFCMQNMIGALLIHWVLGITFMLFVTVSVLQLREVIHPDIMARKIRPQESHPDLLRTLLSERSIKHFRRMLVSLVVYAALLLVLIHLPIRLVNLLCPGLFPLVFRFQYFCAEIQVPIELLVVHLVVLGALEQSKNQIGQLQHLGLTFVCDKLGLKEYLLPRVELTPGDISVLPPPPLHFHPQAVAPPEELRIRGHRYLPWPEDGLQGPQEMEYDLLARSTPKQAAIRTFALLLVAWITCVIIISTFLFGTLFVGRLCIAPFERLTGITHEPLAMAAGVQIVSDILGGLNTVSVLITPLEKVERALVSRGYCVNNMSVVNACVGCFGWAIACPLLTGYFLSACFPTAQASWLESYWAGYLVFNMTGWFVCCFNSKSGRRRNRHRIRARNNNVNRNMDVDGEDAEEMEDENQDEGQEQTHLTPQDDDGLIAAIRKCHKALVFNVTVHDDDNIRRRNDNIREKCFDVQYFISKVLKPVLIILLTMILCPTFLSILLGMTSSEPLGSQRHFAPAAATMSCLSLLVNSHKQLFGWVSKMRESVRNERYLIGRQLQDMAR